MTNEFQFLLRLTSAGSTGETVVQPNFPVDWQKVQRLAQEQAVTALVGYALKRSPELDCPAPVRQMMTQSMRSAAIRNSLKRSTVFALLERMEAAGIHAVMIKGYDAATCYAVPECRVSSDTDIFVDPADEHRASRFLEQEGFRVEPRSKNSHHVTATHPTVGYVELHVQLYATLIENVWFNRLAKEDYIAEEHRQVTTEDGSYYALGYTDHLVFLTLHTVKHFITSGMSVRLMLDNALWMRAYREQIDFVRFWQVMADLKYTGLVNSILHALVTYGGFSRTDFTGMGDVDDEVVLRMLDDLETGGMMGQCDEAAREKSWHEYNRQKLQSGMSKGNRGCTC